MAARFKVNGTNNTAVSTTLSPDSGSGYRLLGDGSTIKYSTSQFYEGTSSITGNGSVSTFFDNGSGTYISDQSATYVDMFVRIPSAPGSDTYLCGGAYFDFTGVYITTDRRLAFKDASGTVRGQSSANLVPTASWFRLRVRYDTTNGADAVWIWTSAFTDDDPTSAGATSVSATASMASGYVCFGMPSSWYFDDIVIAPTSGGNPTHAGATTHTADAAVTATASRTATATGTKSADAAVTATASRTATGSVERFAAAAVTATASTAADVARVAIVDGAVTVTATLAASADVTPAAGTHLADAAATFTATTSAGADVTRVGDASATVAATLAASATVERFATATLTITATATATATIPGQVPTTPGTMAATEVGHATMTAGTSTVAGVPRMATLLSFNAATMQAVTVTAETLPLVGVPVFIGGATSPEAAGLIAAGEQYVWFAGDGTIYVEDGT